MVTLPMKLIGTSLSQVFYQKASEAFNDGKALWPITKKMLTRLSLIGIPSFLVIIFIGPSLFSIVFGGRWHDAGIYAQILMPWIYLVFIGSPIANLSSILGKQKGFFTLTLIGNLGMPIILFCFSILNNQITYLLFLMSFLGCIYYFIAIMWIRSITKINDVKKN
jgi:O-antigen/teichoic acid export membrane protein